MINFHIITVGNLKEGYLKDACNEYLKRLSAFSKVEVIELKETRLPDNPSDKEIRTALDTEAQAILAACPSKSIRIAMCVEGIQISSEDFSSKLNDYAGRASDICFIIGSSFGLSPLVKSVADFKMSISPMTFPHQLMRVILLEQIYRAMTIQKGIRYHK